MRFKVTHVQGQVLVVFFFLMIGPPPRSTLFPYTPLFRSVRQAHVFPAGGRVLDAEHVQALILTVDAVVGADALFDLVDLAHLDLGDQVRVGETSIYSSTE